MVETSDFRNGLHIEAEGDFYTIIWFQHHKPGKGGAVVRVKLRNIHTGAILERTFKSGERFREVNLDRRKKQFLYKDGTVFHFMDMQTYEQIELQADMVGDNALFLKDSMEIYILWLEEKIIGIELPNTVELAVTYTEPGLKGDTATGTTKPATLETGVEVRVPLFINIGDVLRVDTRTASYIERA